MCIKRMNADIEITCEANSMVGIFYIPLNFNQGFNQKLLMKFYN